LFSKQITVVTPQTSSLVALLDARKYEAVIVSSAGLDSGETVVVTQMVDGQAIVVTDAAGDPVILTPTLPSIVLEGGPMYRVSKSSTAAEVGVFATLRRPS
jgi:putative protein kinase ArgK-like GTPase of G3E family